MPSLVLSSGVQARLCGFGVVSLSRFVLGGVALFSMAIPVSMAPVLELLLAGCGFWLPCAGLVFLIFDAASSLPVFKFCSKSCFSFWLMSVC